MTVEKTFLSIVPNNPRVPRTSSAPGRLEELRGRLERGVEEPGEARRAFATRKDSGLLEAMEEGLEAKAGTPHVCVSATRAQEVTIHDGRPGGRRARKRRRKRHQRERKDEEHEEGEENAAEEACVASKHNGDAAHLAARKKLVRNCHEGRACEGDEGGDGGDGPADDSDKNAEEDDEEHEDKHSDENNDEYDDLDRGDQRAGAKRGVQNLFEAQLDGYPGEAQAEARAAYRDAAVEAGALEGEASVSTRSQLAMLYYILANYE